MQFTHSCVNEKHEFDETLQFHQCLVLCEKQTVISSAMHLRIFHFLHLIVARVENFDSHKYEVKNCNKVARAFLDIDKCFSLIETVKAS